MLELILGIGVCVVMAKIAANDNLSGVIWFCVTFAFCVAAMFVPLFYIRFLIAGVLSLITMILYKVLAKA